MSKEDSDATAPRLDSPSPAGTSARGPGQIVSRRAGTPDADRGHESAILHCAVVQAARGRLPERPKGAGCKTVGLAYVGSNPQPATTCGKSPIAGSSLSPC